VSWWQLPMASDLNLAEYVGEIKLGEVLPVADGGDQ
jgi:hypothetical protein